MKHGLFHIAGGTYTEVVREHCADDNIRTQVEARRVAVQPCCNAGDAIFLLMIRERRLVHWREDLLASYDLLFASIQGKNCLVFPYIQFTGRKGQGHKRSQVWSFPKM